MTHPIFAAGRHLAQAIPGLEPSQFHDLMTAVARATPHATSWAEALNAAPGARLGRPGSVQFFTHATCGVCRGRMIDFRRAQACTHCKNGKQYRQVTVSVRYQEDR